MQIQAHCTSTGPLFTHAVPQCMSSLRHDTYGCLLTFQTAPGQEVVPSILQRLSPTTVQAITPAILAKHRHGHSGSSPNHDRQSLACCILQKADCTNQTITSNCQPCNKGIWCAVSVSSTSFDSSTGQTAKTQMWNQNTTLTTWLESVATWSVCTVMGVCQQCLVASQRQHHSRCGPSGPSQGRNHA